MNLDVEQVAFLLFVSAVVALSAKRLQMPYTVGLVIAGIVLAFTPFSNDIQFSKELIFRVFLPALIFEAALYIRWAELRRDLPVVLTFATVGVVLAAIVTAGGMHYIAGWGWQSALVFGFLIAATDPVAVIAMFKATDVQGRLRLLMESESLFNDGIAVAGFAIVVALVSGHSMGALEVHALVITTIFGGVLCGAFVSCGLLLLSGRTDDPLVEMTFTTVAAYGSFLLAEHFHLSGVLATLTAGLIFGNVGMLRSISDKGREKVEVFWDYMAFVANSFIFLLIGIRVSHENFEGTILPILIASVMVIAGRAAAIYPCSVAFFWSTKKVKMRHQHILFWGGLRGGLSLALVLGLPPEIPHRTEIMTVTFGVVALSIFVQGLTMAPLMAHLVRKETEQEKS